MEKGGYNQSILSLSKLMTQRVAKPGDLFLLLVPTGEDLINLQQQQLDLQTRYGGHLVEMIHITVERFTPVDANFPDVCLDIFKPLLQKIEPFPVYCDQIIQFYAPYWEQYVMRWQVQETQDWLNFKEATTLGLAEIGCPSHFVRERHATCTALFMDTKADFDKNPTGSGFPIKLFTARDVLISLLEAPEQFAILETIKLKSKG